MKPDKLKSLIKKRIGSIEHIQREINKLVMSESVDWAAIHRRVNKQIGLRIELRWYSEDLVKLEAKELLKKKGKNKSCLSPGRKV